MTLAEATALLKAAGVDSPAHDAREIFHHFAKIPREELLFPGARAEDALVLPALTRRASREPLQYLIGEVGFYRETYRVTPDCLIPREDTELLVDTAVRLLPRGARFLDLCTGSGCVALSVLKHTDRTSALAVDLSEGALAVAKENAGRLSLSDRVEFLRADATKPCLPEDERFFAILSNPPYVSERAYRALAPELYHEPKEAFLGGEDGGDFYRALIPLYQDRLDRGGFFAFEIGYDQEALLTSLAGENGFCCEIRRDLSGNPRVALLTRA